MINGHHKNGPKLDSWCSPSYRNNNNNNNDNNNNNNNDNNNNIFIFAQTGTYGLSYKNLRRKWTRLGMCSETRLRYSFRSEAGNRRRLEALTATVKFEVADWP